VLASGLRRPSMKCWICVVMRTAFGAGKGTGN
jgi:hypothetical protein